MRTKGGGGLKEWREASERIEHSGPVVCAKSGRKGRSWSVIPRSALAIARSKPVIALFASEERQKALFVRKGRFEKLVALSSRSWLVLGRW